MQTSRPGLLAPSLSCLSAVIDTKLAGYKQELLTEQKEETERMTKRLKLEKKFQFKKGTEV